jgi:hypothetical protein
VKEEFLEEKNSFVCLICYTFFYLAKKSQRKGKIDVILYFVSTMIEIVQKEKTVIQMFYTLVQ